MDLLGQKLSELSGTIVLFAASATSILHRPFADLSSCATDGYTSGSEISPIIPDGSVLARVRSLHRGIGVSREAVASENPGPAELIGELEAQVVRRQIGAYGSAGSLRLEVDTYDEFSRRVG